MRVGPPPTAAAGAYRQGATISIETTDGRKVTNTVLTSKGAACLGIDWLDIEAKYRTLAPKAPMTLGTVEASLEAIRELRTASHVSALIDLLCKSGSGRD